MAALGVPPLLWLAARRTGNPAVNALAWPALGLLFVCMMLSYSRGGLLALAIGLAFWFAVVPLRLRGAVALIAAATAAAPVVAWAFARDALSAERIPLAARSDAGHDLGALLLVMTAVLLACGLAVNFLAAQRPPAPRTRRRGPRPARLPRAGPRRRGDRHRRVAHGAVRPGLRRLEQAHQPAASTPSNTPDRLTATSSVRARYWTEAWHIYESSKLVGAGAGSYVVARSRYRTDRLVVRHAHGYAVQTLADLGLIGIGLSLLVAVAWVGAAMRSTGLRPRDRGLPFDPERIGLLTLATVVVIFATALADRLDLVRTRQRGRRAALRRLGGRAARPARPRLRPAAGRPRGPGASVPVRGAPAVVAVPPALGRDRSPRS